MRLARHAMATRFEIVLEGDDKARLRAAGEEALDEIERLERQLSFYRPSSELSQLNARAAEEWVAVSPPLFRLLETALTLSRLTQGAFDPTIAPLVKAWGFVGASGAWADDDSIAAAREIVGAGRVALDAAACAVRFDRPGVALDLGAIGKGYAVECAAEILRENGVSRALIHGGTSTVAAIGDGWRVAVADPSDAENTLAVLTLDDGDALSVSAVHGKAFVGPDGGVYGHVLDPRLGRPVSGASLAAAVLPSATETDALSTALLVLGADGLPTLIAFRPILSALVVADGGALFSTGAFA